MFYQVIKVGKENIGLVWNDNRKKPLIGKIYLPDPNRSMADKIAQDFPDIIKTPRRIPEGLDELIAGLYQGRALKFDLSCLNWSGLSDFSVKVLRQAFKIPRGKVLTYSGLASKAGSPRAARAAGSVMANNPFPIVIPCHRIIRSGGKLGQFGGGVNMKKHLLEKEGVTVDMKGKVPLRQID